MRKRFGNLMASWESMGFRLDRARLWTVLFPYRGSQTGAVLVSETWPTRLRATAQGFIWDTVVLPAGWPLTRFGLIALKYGLGGGFLVGSAALLIAAMGVVVFIRETKGQELAI